MSTPIKCCYRGCTKDVWSEADGRLAPLRSCATCMTCRRVALCREHLHALYETQDDLQCPGCQHSVWEVYLFGRERLSEALANALADGAGRVLVQTHLRDPGLPPPLPEMDSRPPQPGAPAPPPGNAEHFRHWNILRPPDVPLGTRSLAPGLEVRDEGTDSVVSLGEATEETLVSGRVRVGTLSPGARRAVVEVQPPDGTGPHLAWVDDSGAQGLLISAIARGLYAPIFLDTTRFVCLAETLDQRLDVVEATLAEGNRVVFRRIGPSGGHLVESPIPPVVVQNREAVAVFVYADGGFRAVNIRLADGERTVLSEPGPPPAQLAGSARAGVVAWITQGGDVMCHSQPQGIRTLGTTDSHCLAVSDDGAHLAWIGGGQLTVANVAHGGVSRLPIEGRAVGLVWRPAGSRT